MNKSKKINSLLRFTTAGSVDDGKSTLIGRLLYDSKTIFQDQLETVEKLSKKKGLEHIDLSLLTDGLRSEREQGITIDVAYRYFSTPNRKFIIADTPGHIQYTRNMVTGASTANLALILIDARKGIVEQTKRHSFIASLLGIKHLIVCINKMDLVDYNQEKYLDIIDNYRSFASKLNIQDIQFVPISALYGDNVVKKSLNMKWYQSATLLYLLESVHIASDNNHTDCRLPIQYVIRPHSKEFHDYRGYAGRIASGIFKPGDEVVVLPSGYITKIKSIDKFGQALNEAFSPQSVNFTLEDDLDLSRGDMIARPFNQPVSNQNIDLMICWMDSEPLNRSTKYTLLHTSNEVQGIIKNIQYKVDINTLHRDEQNLDIKMNDIARIQLKLSKPIFTDLYHRNRVTGSVILIDYATNNTVAAGMII